MATRREFLKLSALFSAVGALPLLQACSAQQSANPNAPLRIGYLPITDATPLLIAHANNFFAEEGIVAEKPVLFRSWAQLVEAFLSGQVNMVHLLSPMTIWARYGSKASISSVMWNHMSGSALTVLPEINTIKNLAGKTVAIPFWYSIHNIVLQYLLRENGLAVTENDPKQNQVKIVVMAPADMVAALAAKSVAGFIVAEPFNAVAEAKGIGKILRFTADIWRDHACCVTVMHNNDLQKRPDWVQKSVNALVKAQLWILDNRAKTAALLANTGVEKYTAHDESVLQRVLSPTAENWQHYIDSGIIRHPEWHVHRIDFQPYPFLSYNEKLVDLLRQTHIAGNNDFLQSLSPQTVAKELTDDRFVKLALAKFNAYKPFGLNENLTRHEDLAI